MNLFDVKLMINDKQSLSSEERSILRSLLNAGVVEPETVMLSDSILKDEAGLRKVILDNIAGPRIDDVKMMIYERQDLTPEERSILRGFLNSGTVPVKDMLSHRLLVSTKHLLEIIEENHTKPIARAVIEESHLQRFSPTNARRKSKEKKSPGIVHTFRYFGI